MAGGIVISNLFDFGMTLEEPDLWDIIPDWELRVYDRENDYFATWDIGCPCTHYLSWKSWPYPTNPKYHWNFSSRFIEGLESLYYGK